MAWSRPTPGKLTGRGPFDLTRRLFGLNFPAPRGPLFVDALGEALGQAVLTDFLREYAATYRWQIATAADFQAPAETHCACDLSALFDEWVWGPDATPP